MCPKYSHLDVVLSQLNLVIKLTLCFWMNYFNIVLKIYAYTFQVIPSLQALEHFVYYVKFQVPKETILKMTAFWDMES